MPTPAHYMSSVEATISRMDAQLETLNKRMAQLNERVADTEEQIQNLSMLAQTMIGLWKPLKPSAELIADKEGEDNVDR